MNNEDRYYFEDDVGQIWSVTHGEIVADNEDFKKQYPKDEVLKNLDPVKIFMDNIYDCNPDIVKWRLEQGVERIPTGRMCHLEDWELGLKGIK